MTLSSLSTRTILLALFVLCAGSLAFGLYLQHAHGVAPCPMCIVQRYALIAVGLIALVGGLHGPGKTGSRIYLGLTLLVALSGAGVAIRQSWLQLSPPSLISCGPGWDYMVQNYGPSELLPKIFSGAGDCSQVDWSLFGLSLANYSLLFFSAIAILCIVLMFRKQHKPA